MAEQSGALCDSAKGGIEHVRVDGNHSCHAQRMDDGGGWEARSWTGVRCLECVRSAGVRRRRSTGDPPQ